MNKVDCTEKELIKKLKVFKKLHNYDMRKLGPSFTLANPHSLYPHLKRVGVPLFELLDYASLVTDRCSHIAQRETLVLQQGVRFAGALSLPQAHHR